MFRKIMMFIKKIVEIIDKAKPADEWADFDSPSFR